MSPERIARLKQPRSVLVVILAPDGETLLIERADWPGFWQSVTGSCEPDEHPLQTAQRELFEETGLQADCPGGRLLSLGLSNVFLIYPEFRSRYPAGTTHNIEQAFLWLMPEKRSPILNPREHRAWQWCALDRAAEQVQSWSNRAALQRTKQIVSRISF